MTRPATHDAGRRCGEHAGMVTGVDRIEQTGCRIEQEH